MDKRRNILFITFYTMEQPFQEESSQEETTSSEPNKWAPAVNVAAKNWKSWLAFSKVAPMPAKNWKKDFDQFAVKPMEKKPKPSKTTQNTSKNDDGDVSESSVRKSTPLRRTPLKRSQKPLKKTPLAPIWKKKKERLKNEWSEVDVFREKWETSDKMCEVCSREVKHAFMNGKLVKPQCFAHILAKWMYPRFRLLKENLQLVCSIDCHSRCDEMHLDLWVRRELEEKFNLIISHKNQ